MGGRIARGPAGLAIAALIASTTLWGAGASATAHQRATSVARRSPVGGRANRAVGSTCPRDTASDLRWVSWLYRAFLGRDPSLAAAVPWLDQIVDGLPYADLARTIATSNEASRRVAAAAFPRLLHRPATADELAAWGPWIGANGAAPFAARLMGSTEAYQRAGSNVTGWIDQTYQDVLGRPVEAAGLTYWSGRLASGTSRERVALEIWNTPGHVRLRVDAVYRSVLGRPGDSAGISYWSPLALAQGDVAVAVAMASSQAGWNQAQRTYGAAATTMPAACPRQLRWVPPAGSIVRDLRPVASFGPRLVAFTFDDGPDPTWTPQVLAILARYRIRATFFPVGFQVKRHPDLVRRELAEGHHVGLHTMTHPNLRALGHDAQYREIVDDQNLIEGIAGPGTVRCFRPPYGNRNATTDAIARQRGLATILWSRDGRDWASPGVDTIVQGNLDTRYDGGRGVIILHDGGTNRAQTVAALPRLIDALIARGYQFVQLC